MERGTLRGLTRSGWRSVPRCKPLQGQEALRRQITDTSFTYQRKIEQIETEAALDGIYVLRTSVADTELCHRRGRALLQEPRTGRASVQDLQRPGARDPPDPPPPRRPRPRARIPLHAGLLPHLAPATRLGAAAVQRRDPTSSARPGRESHPLRRRAAQSRAPSAPAPASPATATRVCSPSSPPSPATRSDCPAATRPSTSSHYPPASKHARSTSPSTRPLTRSHHRSTPKPAKTQRPRAIPSPTQRELG